jgi:hypothetical protein
VSTFLPGSRLPLDVINWMKINWMKINWMKINQTTINRLRMKKDLRVSRIKM